MPSHRFELAGFRLAVDAVRRRRGLTWKQVTQQTGLDSAPLPLLETGSNPDVDTIASLVAWADLDPGPFFPMAEAAESTAEGNEKEKKTETTETVRPARWIPQSWSDDDELDVPDFSALPGKPAVTALPAL